LNDGGLYETSNSLSTYNYDISKNNHNPELDREIPRIRILPPLRLPDASRFICAYQNITM